MNNRRHRKASRSSKQAQSKKHEEKKDKTPPKKSKNDKHLDRVTNAIDIGYRDARIGPKDTGKGNTHPPELSKPQSTRTIEGPPSSERILDRVNRGKPNSTFTKKHRGYHHNCAQGTSIRDLLDLGTSISKPHVPKSIPVSIGDNPYRIPKESLTTYPGGASQPKKNSKNDGENTGEKKRKRMRRGCFREINNTVKTEEVSLASSNSSHLEERSPAPTEGMPITKQSGQGDYLISKGVAPMSRHNNHRRQSPSFSHSHPQDKYIKQLVTLLLRMDLPLNMIAQDLGMSERRLQEYMNGTRSTL